jgi:GT2 family glycosyltransferase
MLNRVMIGVPTSGFSRNDEFYDHFNMLEKPEGTICTFARGQSPARNRNLIIEQGLEHGVTHFLFLDDDIAFAPDLLKRLATNGDKDIVSALYLMRNYPHQPIVFDYADSEGRCMHHYPDGNELVEIVACGLGACLIRREVFEKLEKPWIRLGELEKDHWCDDIGFFRRVREAGFKAYCDLSTTVGHMATVKVWPKFENGQWYTVYDTNGKGQVMFPAIVPELAGK